MDKGFFKSKKVLITGATGVIGINLAIALKDTGAEIHLNYLNAPDPSIEGLIKWGFVHKKFDICNLSEITKLEEYDVIFHFAGYGQPKKFVTNPEKTFFLNTSALVDLTKKVKANGHFLFMSSSELYVNTPSTDEDANIIIDPKNSRNCYILGKLCGEQALSWLVNDKNITYKVVRICLAYGEYFTKSDTRVLNELIFKACEQGKIDLMDDGSAVRQYIYIGDAIDMILHILIGGKQLIYNVGGKSSITIGELARFIGHMTNTQVNIGNRDNQLKHSPAFAGVSITRYETEFGAPRFTPMASGLRKCIDWYKSIL